MHKQALFTLINELEAADDALEAIKAIEVYLKKAPPQIHDLVFTRWKTVGETNRIFIKVYAIFYQFTVAVKQNAESKSYIWKLLNEHTWRSNPHPLVTAIWQWIGPHAHHQQVCENGVQAAANVARTLVSQERRSSRVVIVFQIIFDGHQQAFFVKQGRNRNEILLDNNDYHMT